MSVRDLSKETFRIFSLVCYDNNFNDIFKNVLQKDYTYFYIKHLKEEETKKDHTHLVIYCSKATTISKIATDLNISNNDINVLNDKGERYTLKGTIGYLLHYKMENKKQHYELEEIVTNNQELVNKYYNIISDNNNTNRQFKEIISFIEDNNITSLKELSLFCISTGCLDLLKKYQYLLCNILKEERTRY